MKKRFVLKSSICALVLITIVSLFLSSCSTTKKFETTQEECDYALHYVLEKANESTLSTFFFRITEIELFLPSNLSFIAQNANVIPGMPKLLNEWTKEMQTSTLDWFEGFATLTQTLVKETTFEDPEKLVITNDYSASLILEKNYRDRILAYIQTMLTSADKTKWNEIATQYEAWVKTRKILFDIDEPTLEGSNIVTNMAEYICNLYFEDLKTAESLLRTTPDPNANAVVAKVFGLD